MKHFTKSLWEVHHHTSHTLTWQQNSALSSRGSEGQLVEGQDLTTSFQDPGASTSSHLQGTHLQQNGQETEL